MTEDLIDFSLQENESSIIKVIGVGGGGGNAVNYMYKQGIKDVDFVICNTDAQALETSEIPVKIQLGESLTEGRGAGNKPERGEQSAIENLEDIIEVLADNTKMVFITAGMGGGTGTGAAPVIAKAAKEMGILTVGIVTIPFRFEGRQRLHQAIEGINKLKENVDSLLVINNEKLSEIYGDLKLSTAFSKADDVLATAAKGIAEIITLHGYINVDFEDVKTVMTDSGVAVMGSASAEGEDRAVNAIREALTSPLLNSNDVRGARNILLNISSGQEEVTMDEVGQITDYVQEAVGDSASIIWGTGQDLALGNKVSVTIIATGFDNGLIPEEKATPKTASFQAGRGRNSAVDQVKTILEEEANEKSEKNQLILTDLKDTEIDEIENIPAYKRKLKNIDNQKFQSGKVIRFTLDEE
ncbi:cell division protein FtsZ [Labilibaculum euxinus]|uniref:Cell division protein FtsZ n=1 Tax=Labilibaculum euxinus TaxID=2686357 RepID=A0A7M4DA91_9BACT|nr:cell division protein FtsZ [Labilibaculum euxinus]MUP39570.1 cell division protein FtsZ [Labilibaculum euxinus]MVB08775.1 cell division protein FtsZ [Labilibaculum euxinus]